MQLVISIAGVCPLWKEPSYKHEMTSQLLFGEQAGLLEETELFSKVKCMYDGYEGWCLNNQLVKLEDPDLLQLKGYVNKSFGTAFLNNSIVHLPVGTPVYENFETNSFSVHYAHHNFITADATHATNEHAEVAALEFLNAPYIWGGKTNFGTDCSGFVQQTFKLLGIQLPRDAYQQVQFGETVDFLQQAKPGNLAFFDNEAGEIIHVGMLLSHVNIIHASGYVKIDDIDNFGITNSITGKRTHKLRIIKRYF